MFFILLNDPNQLLLFLVHFVKDRELPEIRGSQNVNLNPQHSCFHTDRNWQCLELDNS